MQPFNFGLTKKYKNYSKIKNSRAYQKKSLLVWRKPMGFCISMPHITPATCSFFHIFKVIQYLISQTNFGNEKLEKQSKKCGFKLAKKLEKLYLLTGQNLSCYSSSHILCLNVQWTKNNFYKRRPICLFFNTRLCTDFQQTVQYASPPVVVFFAKFIYLW